MNRLGKALRYLADGVAYAAKAFSSQGVQPVRLLLRGATYYSGVTVADQGYYLRLAAANPYIYNCVTLLAQRCNNPDTFLVQNFLDDNEWSNVENHPFRKLLRAPNSLMTGSALLEDTIGWDSLLGNGYWFLRSPSPGIGPIEEIYPIPADLLKPEPTTLRISTATGQVTVDYRYILTGDLLPGENVVHFRRSNPFDYWIGLSPLSALTNNIETHSNKRKWLSTFFGEGNAIPTAIISVPPELTDGQLDDVTASLREQFGAKRQVAVARSGDLDVKLLQQTMKELELVETFRYDREEINAVYSVPEGLNKAASGQSRLAAETAFARDAVQPLLIRFAGTISQKVMPFYGRTDIFRCVADDVVPQDRALAVSEYATYIQDMTINDGRTKQKQPPLKFSGALAPLQQLLDEVPVRLIPVLAPLLVQQAQAGPGAQQAGGPGSVASLSDALRQMAGENSGDDDLFGALGQMTNGTRPGGLFESTGLRDDNGDAEKLADEFKKLLPSADAKALIYGYRNGKNKADD